MEDSLYINHHNFEQLINLFFMALCRELNSLPNDLCVWFTSYVDGGCPKIYHLRYWLELSIMDQTPSRDNTDQLLGVARGYFFYFL